MGRAKKKTKLYDVYGTVVGGKYLGQVRAASKEEAEEIAWSGKGPALHVSFCHQCSGECENAEITEVFAEEEAE